MGKKSDFALQEINQEFESQRFQLHQASRRGRSGLERQDQLVWRIGIESHARDGQEIGELRRVCCEETDRARQARIDELSSASREESYDCESAFDSDSGLAEPS